MQHRKYEPLEVSSSSSRTDINSSEDESHVIETNQKISKTSYFQNLKQIVYGPFNEFKASFQSLDSCPRELYINFFLKFCESYNYFAISQILVIYMHNEFSISDIEAGTVYGLWGAAITFWGLLTSWINDNLGVRKSLLVGFSISCCATLALAFTTNKDFLLVIMMCILPLGTSMGIPMLTVAIRRYTTKQNRGFAFGLYYSCMNIAAFSSGIIIDFLNNLIAKNGIVLFGRLFSPNRLIIMTASFVCFVSFITTLLFLREIKVLDLDIDVDVEYKNESVDENVDSCHNILQKTDEDNDLDTINDEINDIACELPHDLIAVIQDVKIDRNTTIKRDEHEHHSIQTQEFKVVTQSLSTTCSELIHSSSFWKFAVFTLILVNLNAIFRHLDASLPTYLIRNFGENVAKGTIYAINPFIIIFLTPIVAAFTNKYEHYDMIKYGSYITALSPIFMVFSTSIWATVCFSIVLSLGESIWSPRVYEYGVSVAPEGREASFSALASAPLFAAKVPVGFLSGYLLSTYLPKDGEKDGQTMWLIIMLVTLSSPILITLLETCVREPKTIKTVIK